VEVRLEDRFQHNLESSLDHPVPYRRYPQIADLAAGLGDHPFPYGQRAERTGLQFCPHVRQEGVHAPPGLDVVSGLAVHTGRAAPTVAPHPTPRNRENVGVINKVVEIVEPSAMISRRPTMQLGLYMQYLKLGNQPDRFVHNLQRIGVHR
jgi:hypothetical protein